jgi:phospholipase C
MPRLNRRTFLTGAGAAAAVAATARPTFANIALPGVARRTVRPATPIDTTIVVMQENRSVDHYLGWYAAENRRFDATQQRSYATDDGTVVPTEPWGAGGRGEYAGCGFADPGHGWDSGRVQAADGDGDGEPDGFLREGSGNDEFALATYGADDVPVHAALLRRFTTFDRYFCSVLSSTYPNREYLHSGQGIKDNAFPPETGNPAWLAGFDWPCIWDTLTERGVTWAYYFANLPVTALWGPRYLHGTRHIANFYADAAAGQLPQVCFVDPWFVAPEGLACDDHPHADLRLGQQFLSGVVSAVVESPHWTNAALFITYDEWGGFWDHVAPPVVDDPRAGEGFGQLGFRVPTIVASPWARAGGVDHGLYDHTSILRFVERNYGLRRLSELDPNARSAGRRSIEGAFGGFRRFDAEVDLEPFAYTAPAEAYTTGCGARSVSDLFRLSENGWFDTFGFRTDWRFEDSFRR